MNNINRTTEELDQIYNDSEHGSRIIYDLGREDALNEIRITLGSTSGSNAALIKEAEEWSDGFGSDSQKNAGVHYERSIDVANVLAKLITALEKEEKRNAILTASKDSALSKAANAIYEAKRTSSKSNNPEFDKGVDSAIKWAVGVIESFQEEAGPDND